MENTALVDFKVQVIKQGGLFIAYSHALDISTTGKSEKQAMDTFSSLVKIFVRETIRTEAERPGGVNQILRDLGWTQKAKRWSPPASLVKAAAAH